MEKIFNALREGIRALGLEAIIAPQKVHANRPRIELYLAGIEPAGINNQNPEAGKTGWERITFTAVFKSEGTHIRWVTDTVLALRKLVPLNDRPMDIAVTTDKTYQLQACWKRLVPGRFEYPDEEESSMPVRYAETWEVTAAYPAHIIGPEGPQEEL
jgi:hypothetical protein